MSRTLIYFPVIHTQEDMGTLGGSVRRATMHMMGMRGMRQKVKVIDRLWFEIAGKIDSFALSYETVRLYQDGLTVCGKEIQIVKELAEAGSRNHRLLLSLIDRGAVLMGTESLELLMKEYTLAKETESREGFPKRRGVEGSRKADLDSLLKRRDHYISERINDTLLTGEVGILFLGMLHSVGDKLDRDIRIIYPLKQPSAGRGKRKDDQ